MKKQIAWHEECLANRRRTHDENVREFEKMHQRILKEQETIDVYEAQILCAKADKREGFDREKFMVRRPVSGKGGK